MAARARTRCSRRRGDPADRRAGGKRIRPAFCYWGYRAAGGADGEPIVRAAAALELLHTMALIHDDLMDGSPSGAAARHRAPAGRSRRAREGSPATPSAFGESGALLAGDLAAVLADRLMLDVRLPAASAGRARSGRYHQMRTDMALGQFLDLAPSRRSEPSARIAALKGGSYTVEGPLLVGAALAGGDHVRRDRAAPVRGAARRGVPAPGRPRGRRRPARRRGRGRERAGRRGRGPRWTPTASSPEAVGALSALADLVGGR